MLRQRNRILALCDLCFPEALIQIQVNRAPLTSVVSENQDSWPPDLTSHQRPREAKYRKAPKAVDILCLL